MTVVMMAECSAALMVDSLGSLMVAQKVER